MPEPGPQPITIQSLLAMKGDALDELFKRNAPSAPIDPDAIPSGAAAGTAIVGSTGFWRRFLARFARRFFWQGKVLDHASGALLNSVSIAHLKAIRAQVVPSMSWIDGRPCVLIDYAKTSFVARRVRDEIREVAPGLWLGKAYWGKKPLIHFALEFSKKAQTS